MKRLLQKQRKYPGALLLTLALTLAAFAARADRLTAVRTYDTSAVRLGTRTAPDGTEFRTVEWGDMHPAAEVGSPELPVEHFRFLVPVYSNNFRATVVSATGASALPLGSRVLPAQVPQKADGSPAPEFTYPKAAAYVRTLAPEAWVVDDGFIDGCNHVVTVAVRPVSYDDATLSASAYGSVTVRLDYDLCGEDGLTGSKPIFPPRASEYVRIEDLVVNTANVAQFAPRRVPDAGSGEHSRHYYIIVPDNLKDAVDDLAVWKRQKGYSVVVKTIEDICATPRYVVGGHCSYRNGQTEELVDSAASLRAYLHDEFEDNGAFFCLLVGNSKTSMPIRKAYWGSIHSLSSTNSRNGEFTPTDLYFGDLTTEYTLTSGGIAPQIFTFEYNVYSTVAGYPEIYIGRLLASKKEEILNYTRKLELYESNPGRGNNDYLSSALFLEQYKDPNSGYVSLIETSKQARETLSSIFTTKLIQSNEEGTHPTGKEVIDELNKNYGLFSPHAHGNPFGFATAANRESSNPNGSFYVTSEDKVTKRSDERPGGIWDWLMNEEDGNGLDNLNNKDFPSVVYSISCDNTPFDIMESSHDTEWLNLGESFTCGKDYGGPAYLGNTRSGYVKPSDELEVQFYKAVQMYPKISIAECISKMNFKEKGYRDHMFLTHNIIGDPEFEMWLGKPDTLDFSYTCGGKAINILWPASYGTTVCVSNGTGETRSAFLTGRPIKGFASGFIDGDFAISVWQTGKLPMIRYFGQNATLAGVKKSYIVRDALLGSSWEGEAASKFKVALQAVLSVRAIDSITSTELFEVEDGGTAELKCDKHVNLEGSTVKSGGTLAVEGETVTLGPGFSIEKGGTLTIKTKQ